MKNLLLAFAWGIAVWGQGVFAATQWYYPFDGNCDDAGTNGQHGAASPNVVFADGHKGQCARFSGSDFVSLPLDFSGTQDLSFSFWLKLEGSQPGPYYAMVLSSDANTYGRGFAIHLAGGDYQVWLDDQAIDTGVPAAEPGQWQHVCLTYASGSAKLYLDGQEVYSSAEYTNAPPYNDSTNLLVGLRNLFFDRGVNASVDELQIFDRTLSPEEVRALLYDDQCLLAHYRFEDNLLDSTGHGYNGIPSTNMTYEDSVHGRGLVLPPKPYVRLPIDLNPYGDLSFSFWMKINGPAPGPFYGVFFSTDNNTYGRGLGVNLADNRFMEWYDDGFEYPNATVPPAGQWRHVGMTYEPGLACFYIDGQCVHASTVHTNLPPYNDATNILLGIRNLFYDRGADFSIDELRIYNRALTSNEMQSIFGLGLTVTGIVVEGTSVIGPQRTATFSCFARTASGERIDVTSGSTFHLEPAETNVAWFEGNLLHSGTPGSDTAFHAYAIYEGISGVVTSAPHEVVVRAEDDGCLLAYYPLDGNACDASGNAYDGTVLGANVSTDAVAGTCYSFNGKNRISLPVNLNACEEMSYSLWFKITGTQPGPYYAMLLSSDNNTYGRGISITLTNSDFLLWYDNGWDDSGIHTPTVGEWHQLAATYRPGDNRMYFDGVEVFRDTAHTATAPYNDSTNLLLGLRNRFFDRGFNGLIDEVKIYGCALSSNAVWNDYSAAGDVVNLMPVIQVVPDRTNGVVPCKITFDFTGSYDPDGTIVRSEVDQEGDGLFEQSVEGAGTLSIDYLRPGIYPTALRVVDNFGAMAGASISIVVGGAAPQVVLQAVPASGTAPLSVAFEAEVTPISSNLPASSFEWDFDGDGVADRITETAQVEHVYGQAGEYLARVAVIDVAGVMGEGQRQVTVLPPVAPPACQPALEFFPHTGFSPLPVQLCVLNASNCTYREIEWDYEGDGQVDAITSASSITNLYADPGKYWPVAHVLFDDGSRISLSNLLQISESSDLRVWISQPKDGQTLWGDSISLHANTAPGNQTQGVQFQYRLADATEWTDIGTWLEPPPYSFVQEWDASAIPAGSVVYLRALARDVQDRLIYSDTVQVQVDVPASGDSGAVQAVGDQIQYNVDPEERGQYASADGFEFSVAPFTAPSNQVLSIGMASARSARSLSSFSGRTLLSTVYSLDFGAEGFDRAMQLVIPYPDADGDGFVDGTLIPESTLDAYEYDEASQTWQKTIRSDVDPLRNVVRTLVARSGDIRLAGNSSILQPAHGCVLSASSEASSDAPGNLDDGNNMSYWRADAIHLPMEVVFTFTNKNVALVGGISLLNAGGLSNEPLHSYQIATSLDGTNYVPYASGVLAASDDLQSAGQTSVTCRFVKLVLQDAYSASGATLNEIYVSGSLSTDADQDGIEDVWEIQYFSSLSNDGTGDQDHDAQTDAEEFVAGTDPNDPDSVLNVSMMASGGRFVFDWAAPADRTYTVLCATNLFEPQWVPVAAGSTTGTNEIEVSITSEYLKAFFKLTVEMP